MRHARTASIFALAAALCGSPCQAQEHEEGRQPAPDPVYSGPPLTEEQVQNLYHRFDQGQSLLDHRDDPHMVGVPVSRSVTVTFRPGAPINIIQLARGFPTAITFLDQTGQPWPIAWDTNSNKAGECDIDGKMPNGNGGQRGVQVVGAHSCIPEKGSNVLMLQPESTYPKGGLDVTLQGAPKPIAFLWVTGPGRYDADLTVSVHARGPKALPGAASDTPAPALGSLQAFLDGTPPAEAEPLTVSGVSPDNLRAWKLGTHFYLQSRYEVQSPSPTGSTREFDVNAYEMPAKSPIYLWVGGQPVPVSLTEIAP